MRARRALGVLALVLGCGSPPPPTTTAPAPTVATPAVPVATTVVRLAPTLLDDEQRHRLAAARAAQHDGVERSVVLFDALDIDDGAVLCEAAHAHSLARDLDGADWLIHRALASLDVPNDPVAERREALARCLYDDGRVHAARGDLVHARAQLQRSLSLRDDDTVAAALGHLDASAPTIPRDAMIDEAQRVLVRWVSTARGDDDVRAGQAARSTEHTRTPEGDGAIDREAAVVTIDVDFGDGAFTTSDAFVVLRGPGDTRVFSVARTSASGVGAESQSIEVRSFAYTDAIPGGRPEVALHVRVEENDEDMGECARHGHRDESLVVCSLDDMACASLPERRDRYAETDAGCQDVAPARWHLGGRFEVRLTSGTAAVRALALPASEHPIAPIDYVGAHPVADLLARPELRLVAWGG